MDGSFEISVAEVHERKETLRMIRGLRSQSAFGDKVYRLMAPREEDVLYLTMLGTSSQLPRKQDDGYLLYPSK